MVVEVYGLYHDRATAVLKIAPFNVNCHLYGLSEVKVSYWNEHYYISPSRKALRDKAKQIKNDWIIETQLRLDLLKELTVINKY